VVDVVLLALGDGAGCGTRTPILACQDAFRTAGAEVSVITAAEDADIDAALKPFDRAEGSSGTPDCRLVVASATDGQLRAVVRRLVRLYAPKPSKRPADLRADRTVPDLPPIGVLPLGPDDTDLATRLGLPREPAAVAAAVLGGQERRLDLLRTDSGSVTLDGALLGGLDEHGKAAGFRARVEVDDAVLTDGMEQVLVAAVANFDRYVNFGGLPLLTATDNTDGVIDVAVALPHSKRRLLGGAKVEVEVRRAHGRAVAITPREEVPYADDGVAAKLTHKRSWWMEAGAWAVYVTG
jgi:hypothetical protein